MTFDAGISLTGEEPDTSPTPAPTPKKQKKFYVSLAVNVVLLSGVLCLSVLYIVWLNNDYKDDPQACRSAHPPPEESFHTCSPCEPMIRTDDADTMRLFMKSSSMVCCKRISPVVKIEVSINEVMIE